ncbi:Hypothetical protein HVR_LOCUS538 [uncultured virus]|nr:Hypothetical protein HVR_LOCUS538 [uncultured virus]
MSECEITEVTYKGRKAFKNRGLLGISEVYESFPERLQDTIIRKQAELYNCLASLLTLEEEEEIPDTDDNHFNDEIIENLEKDLKYNLDLLGDYSSGRFTEAETRKRFPNMPEEFIESRLAEYKENVRQLEAKNVNLRAMLDSHGKSRKYLQTMSVLFEH